MIIGVQKPALIYIRLAGARKMGYDLPRHKVVFAEFSYIKNISFWGARSFEPFLLM